MSNQKSKEEGSISAKSLAADSSYSVAQYYRRFQRQFGEQPVKQHKRLLLERAAYDLTRTEAPISAIALRANFKSFEGFSRAFRRAFGVSASDYRFLGASEYRLEPQKPIHFAPSPASMAPWQGESPMTMLDRMIGSHEMHVNQLLDLASTLTDEQLDLPIPGYFEPVPWMPDSQTLRSLLRTLCNAPGDASDIDVMRKYLRTAMANLITETTGYEKDNLWDMTFVDSNCEPPQVFSYAGWIGHVVSLQFYRRMACMGAIRQLGLDAPFFGPNEFDMAQRQADH